MFGVLGKGLAPVQRYVIIGMGAAVLTMIAAISALSWYVLDLKEQNGSLEQSVAQKTQTISDLNIQIADLQKDLRKTDRLIVQRDDELLDLRRNARWREDELMHYMQEASKAWSNTAVPNGVTDRLFPLPDEDRRDD